MIPVQYYLAAAFALYTIGIYCLVTKKNMIRLVIGVDILSNAAHLTFIAFASSAKPGFTEPLAHSIVIISMAMEGCAIAVALALVMLAYRRYGTRDVRELRRLRW